MNRFIETHIPCPCGQSSDAYSINLDTSGHCFSCGKHYRGDQIIQDSELYGSEVLSWRGINKETFLKYGCVFKVNVVTGEPVEVGFPYSQDTWKIRSYDKKSFRTTGNMGEARLFGMDTFPAGSADYVVVTEGELDALSSYQILNKPSVSVRGASSAFGDCRDTYDYLNSFNRIYLAFDNDLPGQEAVRRVAALFDNTKVYHVKMPKDLKDPNGFLQAGKTEEYKNVVFYSRRFIPSEIISSFADIDRMLGLEREKEIVSFPFAQLQAMTYGIRKGIILVTAQEGQGKTEIIRAIEAHILRTTDINLGIIHLEESTQRSIQGLSTYELGRPVHLPDSFATTEDILRGFKSLARRDERVHIINHFPDDDLRAAMDLIRFLVVRCGCRVVFLDHITIMVTGLEEQDERRKLDYLSTQLERMTEELDFSLIMVSHVNDDGKTRGSRNISKVANIRIDLQRDHLSPNPIERNKTYLTVSKNRDAAKTGPAGILYFNPETFIVGDFDENLS